MNNTIHRIVIFFRIAALLCSVSLLCACSLNPHRPDQDSVSEADLFSEEEGKLQILTIGTADSGGTMYPVGSAIASAISSRDENIKVNTSASNGSLTNVKGLLDGQIDLGLVSGDVAFCAYNGTEEFAGQPATELRAIAAVYSSLSNWMAPDSTGLYYVHDLGGRRIAVGPKDSTTELSARTALAVVGLSDYNTTFKNYGLGSGGVEVERGNVDALHGFAGIPVNGLTSLAKAVPSHLLKYTDKELDTLLSNNLYYYKTSIPAGTYPGQTDDVKTFGVKCLVCVSTDMSDELVYTLTKILDESRAELIGSHETLATLEQNGFMCQDIPIPLHAGAKQYYKDVGYLNE